MRRVPGRPARRSITGAWVPLRHLLPGATVPVFQVSMPVTLDAAGALRLGRDCWRRCANEGVMIVGSGSLTHNLYDLRPPGSGEVAYAREFAELGAPGR
ncbi:MAG: hypothetical protein MZW92_38170 [Comamonadaceae bacterium]|nr:hypothetical protein [Comamonadaceae bacterium]